MWMLHGKMVMAGTTCLVKKQQTTITCPSSTTPASFVISTCGLFHIVGTEKSFIFKYGTRRFLNDKDIPNNNNNTNHSQNNDDTTTGSPRDVLADISDTEGIWALYNDIPEQSKKTSSSFCDISYAFKLLFYFLL